LAASGARSDQGGHNPTGDEDANDREAEIREVVIQSANDAPETTFMHELITGQPETVGNIIVKPLLGGLHH
jgi:hypothetical protein